MRIAALRFVPVMMGGLLAGAAAAEDWPQWRGESVTGVTQDDDFKADFLAGGQPKVLWSKNVGIGYSPVTIADGKAFTAGWQDGKDFVYCFDADTGDVVWSKSYDSPIYDKQHAGGPSDAIAVDDERAFHYSRDARLFCYDTDNGNVLWQINLAEKYNVNSPRWMFAGSAVVEDETVYLDVGHILALNPESGEEIWKTPNYGAAYATPMPFELHGKKLLATFPAAGLVVLDRETGHVVAQHKWETKYGVNATTPIIAGDEIFISSGYNTGCAMLQLTNVGLKLVWESRDMRNQLPTSILVGDYIYGFDDKQLKCIAVSDGKEQWSERGLGQGALIANDDTLIVLSEDGELITAKATPDGFNPIARARVLDEGGIWIMPTLADGKVYCRAPRGTVVCIDTEAE